VFDTLSQRLQAVWDKLKRHPQITEDILKEVLREVRIALIEADVGLPVVRSLIAKVQEKALGQEVIRSLSPDQMVIRIVLEETVDLLGGRMDGPDGPWSLPASATRPSVIMMVGLQGAGKTTTSVKLGLHLLRQQRKKVGLCSLDVRRPAAREQLATGARHAGLVCLDPDTVDVQERARVAMETAQNEGLDVLVLDTAGRLHTDEALMNELQEVRDQTRPVETFLVADSMTGQDAVRVAGAFQESLGLTGLVLTRMDGDARGGACLSMRAVTGCPVRFMGTGEKPEALEIFHPERIARRILGMGDVLSLIDQATEAMADQDQELLARRAAQGQFDMTDLMRQLQGLQKMGGIQHLVRLLPGSLGLQDKMDKISGAQREVPLNIAIIRSMTPAERSNPKIINGSRRRRIAAGSGTSVMLVNRLLKQHQTMATMMKQMRSSGGGGRALPGTLPSFSSRRPPFR
jgi:signal recognition particle subunit SRP54